MPVEHKVKQGECISSIAYKYGFFPDTLQQDAGNSDLKSLRVDCDIMNPGDVIHVPDKTPRIEEVPTDQRQTFLRKGIPAYLKLQLLDGEQQPCSNVDFTLSFSDKTISDSTDIDGYIDKPIPPDTQAVKLTMDIDGNTIEYDIPLGNIDPIEETRGIQERLHNLGYDCGSIDGRYGDKTRSLIKHFQHQQELEVTGDYSDETKEKLLEVHGS